MSYLSILAIVALLGVVNTVSTWLILRSAEAERLGLELATSEGREAVARDVHDLIGHSLTVVGLKAQLVRRLMDSDPERAKAELADIERLTAEAIAGVRSTVAGARVTTLVEQLASSRDSFRAADIEMQVEGEPSALSPVQAITASWILREATTNTLRHARARRRCGCCCCRDGWWWRTTGWASVRPKATASAACASAQRRRARRSRSARRKTRARACR